jgi:hypothetical protein
MFQLRIKMKVTPVIQQLPHQNYKKSCLVKTVERYQKVKLIWNYSQSWYGQFLILRDYESLWF